jgi:hypothetical protein
MTNFPGLVSESCHESTFKLIRQMADGDQLWSVPKLEYDLLRRNASTNVRKTDLIERYILHRKPKHTIYVRYFSILLYFLIKRIGV